MTDPSRTDPVGVADTIPYAWPWDGALDGTRLALVLAGSDDAWRAAAPLDEAAGRHLAQVADAVRAAGGLVVHVHHPASPARTGAPGAAPTVLLDDAPAPLTPLVADDARDERVVAAGLDGFFGSPLDTVLRAAGRDHLVLAGWGLEGPVHSTLRSANDQGYECLLLTDAVGAVAPGTRAPALSMVTMSGGIFGALGSSDALRAALARLPSPAPTSASESASAS